MLELADLVDYPKAATLDLAEILASADPTGKSPRYHLQERNDRVDTPLDDQILQDAEVAIAKKEPIQLSYPIRNTHRTVGAKLSGEIAFRYGDTLYLKRLFDATSQEVPDKVLGRSVSAVSSLS